MSYPARVFSHRAGPDLEPIYKNESPSPRAGIATLPGYRNPAGTEADSFLFQDIQVLYGGTVFLSRIATVSTFCRR
jgi:hypothetical protein